LSDAFGIANPNSGIITLADTYLTIHPNCRHVLTPYTEESVSREERDRLRKEASEPYHIPPEQEGRVRQYREAQDGRAKLMRDYSQWQQYRASLGKGVPKTFQTFLKHKLAGDDVYAQWQNNYREQNRRMREAT
jgi:hypothetical protein